MFIYGRGCRKPSFFSEVAAEAGEEVSALAYAVGTINLKGLGRLTSDDFLQDYQVNGGCGISGSSIAWYAEKNKGSILFFSSVAAQLGLPMHASIGALKGRSMDLRFR